MGANRHTAAFQGEPGAYSELAARKFLHASVRPVPRQTFDDVFRTVKAGQAKLGVVPIENSIAGSIHKNYDRLLKYGLPIVGEYHLRICHCLVGIPATSRRKIRVVASHPQALDQCAGFLSRLNGGVAEIASEDTAASASAVAKGADPTVAAIASREAARQYGLKVLATDIEDDPENYTRFLFVARRAVKPAGKAKTSIVFALKNVPGALFKALGVFAERDIDLTKIESRPLVGTPGRYRFYLDFRGAAADADSRAALKELRRYALDLRTLGSYSAHSIPRSA